MNSQPLIVALSDDLTGALGLSMLIANENIAVQTVTSVQAFLNLNREELNQKVETLVLNTNTRSLPPGEARQIIDKVMQSLPPNTIVAKRFDTTLRGHLDLELDAIMTRCPHAAALIVPSYPDGGRLCIGGHQLLHGMPLERTEAATDSHWPISSSYVPSYFSETASRRKAKSVQHLPMEVLSGDEENLVAELKRLLQPGTVLVADACNNDDINLLARAAAHVENEVIFSSPGVFISAVLGTLFRKKQTYPVLAVNGSATELTRIQIALLEEKYRVNTLEIPSSSLERSDELAQSFMSRYNPKDMDVLVIRPKWKDAGPGLEKKVLDALTEAAHTVLAALKYRLSGLILSGGETASSVLLRAGTNIIRPERDFGALVMGGKPLDGLLADTKIVTKGGLVGDKTIFYKVMTWFLKENE